MTTWPQQKDCDRFYGNPRGLNGGPSAKWEAANLVSIKPPYRMTYAGKPISGIRVHKKCAESLKNVLDRIWEAAGQDQATVDRWGASIYGGAYNYRLMRGGNSLSMHSWGCAIDLDPARNGLGDQTPHFANVPEVLEAFAAEGWEWGGDWSRRDGMHWQAAWTRAQPARVGRSTPMRAFSVRAEDVGVVEEEPADALAGVEPGMADDVQVIPQAPLRVRQWTKEQVEEFQRKLADLGYDPGGIDGRPGTLTKGAVTRMQAVNGVFPASGELDVATVELLMGPTVKPMQVSAERAAATSAQIAAKVPVAREVRRSWLAQGWAYVTGLAAYGVANVRQQVGDAIETVKPFTDWLGTNVTPGMVIGAVAVVALFGTYQAWRANSRADDAYKTGKLG
jgi:hypothetical protein